VGRNQHAHDELDGDGHGEVERAVVLVDGDLADDEVVKAEVYGYREERRVRERESVPTQFLGAQDTGDDEEYRHVEENAVGVRRQQVRGVRGDPSSAGYVFVGFFH
jgi:hypothetical protein